ncbi:MAG: 2-dehydropantoate 2-reductase N-terminal domain-containing protein, partial [Pseudomonadota bacterium]
MRIAVVGIGGVGGYFGGLLARYYGGREETGVVFIARGEHLRKIQEKGLELITRKVTFSAVPERATDRPKGCGIFDLVLFCVKSYDLDEAAHMIRGNVTKETVLISLLNGVDNAERLGAL